MGSTICEVDGKQKHARLRKGSSQRGHKRFIEGPSLKAEHGDPTAALSDLDDAVGSQPELADAPDVIAGRARATERLAARRPRPAVDGTTRNR
jgi:hypothetical protein